MHVLDTFAQLYLLHDPPRYVRMLRPGARSKYHIVHRAPTPDDLHAHLTGAVTIGVPLIGAAGLSSHVALDIDQGGRPALEQALAAAHTLGWTAYAISSTTTDHCGGHLWVHLDQPVAPDRARQLASAIAQAAQLSDVEAYPTHRTLRLPFGRHTWTGTRGTLLLPNGQDIDLDARCDVVHTALAQVAALPLNQTANLPSPPSAPPQERARQTRQERAGATNNPIHAYNHTTHLLDLLERSGGRIAEQYHDGGALLHCPCGQHQHGDAHPSLEVRPARNTARYGQYVAIGYAPSCRLATERGQVLDSFTVYCRLTGLSPTEALAQHRMHTPEVPA